MAKHSSPVRHSRGVSLANRGAGSHFYRDEVTGDGGKRHLRRRVRTLTKRETRAIVAEELAAA